MSYHNFDGIPVAFNCMELFIVFGILVLSGCAVVANNAVIAKNSIWNLRLERNETERMVLMK